MKTIKFLALSLVAFAGVAFDAAAEVEKVRQYQNTPDRAFNCFVNNKNISGYLVSPFVKAACILGNQSIQFVQDENGAYKILTVNVTANFKEKQNEFDRDEVASANYNVAEIDFGEIKGFTFTDTDKSTTAFNTFFGNEPKNWGALETFSKMYVELTNGNRVVFYDKKGVIGFDAEVKSGSAFNFDLVGGTVSHEQDGSLSLTQDNARLVITAPECFSGNENGTKVNCVYATASESGAVTVSAQGVADQDYLIDPGVIWMTLFGGTGSGTIGTSGVEVVGNDDVVIAGTALPSLVPAPTAGVWSAVSANTDGFVSKFSADGATLLFHTVFGGSGFDSVASMAVDQGTGDIVVAGSGDSSNFPTTLGAYDTTFNDTSGSSDAFILRFNSVVTSLVFSTYLGGNDLDGLSSIRIASSGDIFFAGNSKSGNFPCVNAFQNSKHGTGDAVFGILNLTGSSLTYSSYLGGTETSSFSYDRANDIMFTNAGDLVVLGVTFSQSFPVTTGAMDIIYNGTTALADGFIFKLAGFGSPSQSVAATFLGGSGSILGVSIGEMSDGTYTFVGNAGSGATTTVGAYDTTLGGTSDVYLGIISANLSSRLYGTFIGGSGVDSVNLHNLILFKDSIIVCGSTRSSDYPTSTGTYDWTFAHPTNPNNFTDSFITKLTLNSSSIYAPQYSTFLGSSVGSDVCQGLSALSNGNVIVAGSTAWTFGNPNNLQATAGAYSNAGRIFFTEMDLLPTGASKYGVSSDTSVTYHPIMDINSSPTSGNTSFAFQLWGAPPGALCLLGASVVPDVLGTDLYGIKWHLDILSAGLAGILFLPDINYPMLTDAAGNLTMPLPLPTGIAGLQVCFQWYCFWVDNVGLQLAASNAIDVTIQP